MFSSLSKTVQVIVIAIFCLPIVIASIVAIFLAVASEGNLVVPGCAFAGISFFGLFFAIPVAAIVIFVAKLSSAADRNQLEAYEAFAESVGGRVVPDKVFWGRRLNAIELTHRRLEVFVTSEFKRHSEGYSQYSCFEYVLPRQIAFRCDVAPRRTLDFRRANGLTDVMLGMAEFDQRIRLRANHKMMARKCFGVEAQQGMMELIEFSKQIRSNLFDSGQAYLAIDGMSIKFRIRGAITKTAEMEDCYRMTSRVVDDLVPALLKKQRP